MPTVLGAHRAARRERRAGDRRRRRVSLRYPERRTGFDRRFPGGGELRRGYARLLLGYRRSPAAVASVLAAFVTLNALDMLFTWRALASGAVEANPVMAGLLGYDLGLAVAFKLTVGIGVAMVIWRYRRYRRVLETSLVLLAAFSVLLAYHAVGVLVLAG